MVVVVGERRRPGGQVAQAHGAVERLVAQSQRGHGAAAAAGPGSRRLSGASVRPLSASVRHCRATLAFFQRFFARVRGAGAGGGPGPANGCDPPAPRPRSRALARPLLFTCHILKGFSAGRYGFSSTGRYFTYGTGLEFSRCGNLMSLLISTCRVACKNKIESSIHTYLWVDFVKSSRDDEPRRH